MVLKVLAGGGIEVRSIELSLQLIFRFNEFVNNAAFRQGWRLWKRRIRWRCLGMECIFGLSGGCLKRADDLLSRRG